MLRASHCKPQFVQRLTRKSENSPFLLLHPACKYYPVLLCIDSVILGRMLRTVRLDVCRPFNTLTVVIKSLLLIGSVLVWNSGWTEDAVCRSEAAAIAAVILYCFCCNFSSLWRQERFKECLLHLQRNHWKLQQGKTKIQAFMSFVFPTKCEFVLMYWMSFHAPKSGVSNVGHSGF